MSLISRIIARVFPAEAEGLAHRAWTSPAHDGARQPPPNERTAMAPPADVAMMLDARARHDGHGADWRGSLDDLLALLGLAASERPALAAELNLDDASDAALYEALMQRLSENGAAAPESFYK